MSWWQASLSVPTELAEAVAWLLAERTGIAAEVQDTGTLIEGETVEDARVLLAFAEPPPKALQAHVTDALAQLGLTDVPVFTRKHDDDSWRTGWRAFFNPRRLSQRIWVHPPWLDPPAEATIPLVIDPGLAFGTGGHATTRAVMSTLDRILADRPQTRLLDVGCGSGILSIAAALMGHRAVGIEIDATALKNARANITANGVDDRVSVLEGSADATDETFTLVVANIIAPILIEIAPQICARAAETLILSGVLADQVSSVRAAYPDFALVTAAAEGPWQALHLRRR